MPAPGNCGDRRVNCGPYSQYSGKPIGSRWLSIRRKDGCVLFSCKTWRRVAYAAAGTISAGVSGAVLIGGAAVTAACIRATTGFETTECYKVGALAINVSAASGRVSYEAWKRAVTGHE